MTTPHYCRPIYDPQGSSNGKLHSYLDGSDRYDAPSGFFHPSIPERGKTFTKISLQSLLFPFYYIKIDEFHSMARSANSPHAANYSPSSLISKVALAAAASTAAAERAKCAAPRAAKSSKVDEIDARAR